jgi:hypothetical protein
MEYLLKCSKCKIEQVLEFETPLVKCQGDNVLPCECGGWLTYKGRAA